MSTNYGANNDIYLRNDVTAHSSVITEKFEVDDDGVGNDDMNDAFHSNNVNGELTNATNKFVRQHGYLVLDNDKYGDHTMFQPHIGLCSEPPFIFWIMTRILMVFLLHKYLPISDGSTDKRILH